jgi:hypothetical protein
MTMSLLAALLALATSATAESSFSQSRDNPIRRVVTMLQTMQAKVLEEGKKDAIIHDRYMCFCKSNGLEDAVAAAEKKNPRTSEQHQRVPSHDTTTHL